MAVSKSDLNQFLERINTVNINESDLLKYFELLNEQGMQPLLIACQNGKIEYVKLLLDHKYNIDAGDITGMRPIDLACEQNDIEIVKLLLDYKCNIDSSGYSRMRPIDIACERGHIEIVKLLLDHKCNVDVSDGLKRLPIHFACENGHIEIVKLLLDHKCDINARDCWGMRPINIACERGYIELVKLLLQYKCDVEFCYDKSLKIAGKNKYKEIIDLLRAAKKNPSMCSIALAMSLECESGCSHRSCFISFTLKKLKEKCHSIGSGAFGTIYKCSGFQQEFAIKVIKVSDSPNIKREAKKIEKEINKYKHILKHDNIVEYFGSLSESNEMAIFMECVDGKSLDKYINLTALPHDIIAKFSKQILDGVGFLHKKKIIHRDIKPANILLDSSYELIKLCDFGISCSLATISTLTTQDANTVCGTFNYMAPEVFMEKLYDFKADIWSIGATVIEMLTGYAPFSGSHSIGIVYKISQSKTIEFTPVQPMSPDLKSFVDQMIQFEPENRATAYQLLQCEFINPMLIDNDW